jgi:putative endonuclease
MGTPPRPRPPRAALDRAAVGRRGEELAVEHLERLGYRVLARNVRVREGEIDVIAFDGVTIVFVEVKSRRLTSTAAGPVAPLEGLSPRQQARLRRLAAAWLSAPDPARLHPRARELRLDAIGVVIDRRGALLSLEHLEGAW